jgi:hypothetical protein
MKNAFVILTDLDDVSWFQIDTAIPVTFETDREAQEYMEDMDDDELAACEGDRIEPCILHDDNTIEIPSLGVRWDENDLKRQRGMPI